MVGQDQDRTTKAYLYPLQVLFSEELSRYVLVEL